MKTRSFDMDHEGVKIPKTALLVEAPSRDAGIPQCSAMSPLHSPHTHSWPHIQQLSLNANDTHLWCLFPSLPGVLLCCLFGGPGLWRC